MKNWIFILGLMALWGCHKGPVEYTLKGTITDNTFSTGLSNANVYLYEIAAGGGDETLIGQSILGSDGTYTFTFDRTKAESYRIVVTKSNYFEIDEIIYQSSMTSKEDNVRDFSTTAKAWARVHLSTTNPSGHLRILKTKGKVGCSECCPDGEIDFIGPIDTVFYCINDGNTLYEYNYYNLFSSQVGFITTSTVAFDTTDLVFNY